MGLVTYLTRIGGDLLMRNRELGRAHDGGDERRAARHLTAMIAPSVLDAGPAEAIAGLATVFAAFRLPLTRTILVGAASIVMLRTLL